MMTDLPFESCPRLLPLLHLLVHCDIVFHFLDLSRWRVFGDLHWSHFPGIIQAVIEVQMIRARDIFIHGWQSGHLMKTVVVTSQ